MYQESLDSFLSIAEELELKGFVGKGNKNECKQDYLPKERRLPTDDGKAQNSERSQVQVQKYKTVALANHFSSGLQKETTIKDQ